MLNAQVSKQVEIGGRIHSRFNQNYWANYGGFAVPDQPITRGTAARSTRAATSTSSCAARG